MNKLNWRILLIVIGSLLTVHLSFAQVKTRLTNNWEYIKQDLGGIWEAVRPVKKGNPEEIPLWTTVS
ncbi:MAG TPA: hypothetical protein VFU29_25020 [Chitinophagaceae bacterium]|nr:hypothetical protein [Chitinophagaceae bacterium]